MGRLHRVICAAAMVVLGIGGLSSQPASAGFWHLGDDYIEFHVVSSVGILKPEMKEYIGSFSMASIDAMETKVERNHLELAVRLGEKMNHWKLDRCKK